MNKLLETVKDIIKNPAKYRKAAVVPVGAGIAILSIVLGADSKVVLEVVSIAEGLGVYFVPNAKGSPTP